jgi:hypothetical protein
MLHLRESVAGTEKEKEKKTERKGGDLSRSPPPPLPPRTFLCQNWSALLCFTYARIHKNKMGARHVGLH